MREVLRDRTRGWVLLATLLATLVATGTGACTVGGGPSLPVVGDQTVAVGQELVVTLAPISARGAVSYRFSADYSVIRERAAFAASADGAGVFRWTPSAADLGEHVVTLVAKDSRGESETRFGVAVRTAVGDATVPRFIEPLGAGTILDVTVNDCLALPVVIDDQDTAQIAIAQEAPVIEGAVLQPTGAQTATWTWCPSEAQVQAGGKFALVLSADDGEHPKALKSYVIIVRNRKNAECPGESPELVDLAADQHTLAPVRIEALADDDLGLKYPPLLHFAFSESTLPPPSSAFQYVVMTATGASGGASQWAVELANPTVGLPTGTKRYLHYSLEAEDDDDVSGHCDHLTRVPTSGYQRIKISNPGGTMDSPMCAACSADVQCGPGDLCALVGVYGFAYCLQECTTEADCPNGSYCSALPITSVDGASARQCVPDYDACVVTVACEDDAWEENDTRVQAAAAPALTPQTYDAMMCPSRTAEFVPDEDWYRLELTADSQVVLEAVAEASGDAQQLTLYDGAGGYLGMSSGGGGAAVFSRCLGAGTYYARASSYWSTQATPYLLSYEATPADCSQVCQDDANEPSNSAAGALAISPPFAQENLALCQGDEDWYEVYLFDGETMRVQLTFEQADSSQDIDLHLYRQDGAALTDLTPCTEAEPYLCTPEQGQSADSDEELLYTASCPDGCLFYVVVEGFDGASHPTYGIRIESEQP